MSWIDIKKTMLNRAPILTDRGPLFGFVEFNVLNYCNRNCSFCPVTEPNVREAMTFERFIKAIDDLYDLSYKGIIGFSGFCEPTLHPRIAEFIGYAHHKLPAAIIVLNTNGDDVGPSLIDLYKKVGISYIIVSAYDVETYNRCKGYGDSTLVINKRFAGDMIKNNRAGALYTSDAMNGKPCNYPFYMIYINHDGEVLFCSHNYEGSNALGHIDYSSIGDIWYGPRFNRMRESVLTRSAYPCNQCDVVGTMMGDKYYAAWHDRLFK